MKNKQLAIDEVARPVGVTRSAMSDYLRWIDACRKLGWGEDQMDALENLWWKHHDKDGKNKSEQTIQSLP